MCHACARVLDGSLESHKAIVQKEVKDRADVQHVGQPGLGSECSP